LNRGTVAEYLRGYCFRIFILNNYDMAATVEVVSGNGDAEVQGRVQKKIEEYLRNAVELVDRSKTFDHSVAASRAKYKNLPQRYHPVLDEIIDQYYRATWKCDP